MFLSHLPPFFSKSNEIISSSEDQKICDKCPGDNRLMSGFFVFQTTFTIPVFSKHPVQSEEGKLGVMFESFAVLRGGRAPGVQK